LYYFVYINITNTLFFYIFVFNISVFTIVYFILFKLIIRNYFIAKEF